MKKEVQEDKEGTIKERKWERRKGREREWTPDQMNSTTVGIAPVMYKNPCEILGRLQR